MRINIPSTWRRGSEPYYFNTPAVQQDLRSGPDSSSSPALLFEHNFICLLPARGRHSSSSSSKIPGSRIQDPRFEKLLGGEINGAPYFSTAFISLRPPDIIMSCVSHPNTSSLALSRPPPGAMPGKRRSTPSKANGSSATAAVDEQRSSKSKPSSAKSPPSSSGKKGPPPIGPTHASRETVTATPGKGSAKKGKGDFLGKGGVLTLGNCLLYTSPSPRD